MLFHTWGRQELRKKLNLPHGDFATVAGDCCSYCWCGACAVTQEAQQVELAVQEGKLKLPEQTGM